MMKLLSFWFREGSSLIFAIFILAFSMFGNLGIPDDATGLFTVTMIALGYLGLQMALAGFARVGQDKPLLDLFFSLLPVFALFAVIVLEFVGQDPLTTRFEWYAATTCGVVAVWDVIFNTQVVFKMNRLATDMVQMR